MLEKNNLDDMTYAQLLSAADITLEEWSDRNAHDPGITLIELFAWLTEMQRFYINSVEFAARPAVHSAAVSMSDYEELVMQVPGVLNAKAYPDGGHRICVAVDGSYEPEQILRHLEPYRLMGTEVAVVPPLPVKLRITAEVTGQPFRRNISPIVEEALKGFVMKKYGGFGARADADEITGFLRTLPVIAGVRALELNAEGLGVRRDVSGGISLSPRSILQWGGLVLYVH